MKNLRPHCRRALTKYDLTDPLVPLILIDIGFKGSLPTSASKETIRIPRTRKRRPMIRERQPKFLQKGNKPPKKSEKFPKSQKTTKRNRDEVDEHNDDDGDQEPRSESEDGA
jgi:hypothetical protein